MKRCAFCLLVLLVLPAISSAQPARFYGATGTTGGAVGDLDRINGAVLNDEDGGFVVDPDDRFNCHYTLDATSGLTETAETPCPYVIRPDANYGTKRWLLVEVEGLNIPVGTDPDVATEGYIGRDTDDHALRGYGDGVQYLYGAMEKTFTVSFDKPKNLSEADNFVIFVNHTAFTYVITEIHGYSDTDDVDFTLKEMNDMEDFTDTTTIEAVDVNVNGTGVFYRHLTSGIDHTNIEADHGIAFDNNAVDDPDSLTVVVVGYFDSNVP